VGSVRYRNRNGNADVDRWQTEPASAAEPACASFLGAPPKIRAKVIFWPIGATKPLALSTPIVPRAPMARRIDAPAAIEPSLSPIISLASFGGRVLS